MRASESDLALVLPYGGHAQNHRIQSEADDVTLCLQGSVAGPWIGELERAASMKIGARSLTLDLGEVRFIDRDALPMFRNLAKRGVRVAHCTAFARTLLKDLCQ